MSHPDNRGHSRSRKTIANDPKSKSSCLHALCADAICFRPFKEDSKTSKTKKEATWENWHIQMYEIVQHMAGDDAFVSPLLRGGQGEWNLTQVHERNYTLTTLLFDYKCFSKIWFKYRFQVKILKKVHLWRLCCLRKNSWALSWSSSPSPPAEKTTFHRECLFKQYNNNRCLAAWTASLANIISQK